MAGERTGGQPGDRADASVDGGFVFLVPAPRRLWEADTADGVVVFRCPAAETPSPASAAAAAAVGCNVFQIRSKHCVISLEVDSEGLEFRRRWPGVGAGIERRAKGTAKIEGG